MEKKVGRFSVSDIAALSLISPLWQCLDGSWYLLVPGPWSLGLIVGALAFDSSLSRSLSLRVHSWLVQFSDRKFGLVCCHLPLTTNDDNDVPCRLPP